MFRFPIGAMLESFNLPTAEALEKAASLGIEGIQLYASRGEFSAETMTDDKIRELMDMMNSNGLVFSALCGDLGKGFGHPELNPELIEKSKRILDLAKKLGTDVVTTHIGVVPTDPNHPRYAVMQEACYELATYADSVGAHFAIETGPETSETLKGFLDSLGSTGVSVNLDPANLVMVTGDDPVVAVHNLQKYIVHTHAKDGNMLTRGNPEEIYGVTPMPEDMKGISFFEEVPLGTGTVDFPAYLKALEEIGYRGYLTIERECGENPARDIAIAADFLRKTIEEN
ncbi:MAG: sugar phosphate isomerase/epimerase [Clostridia bacterium]|nr:sugar phosphate isomerase/epimerase [Clostridia bacterium]